MKEFVTSLWHSHTLRITLVCLIGIATSVALWQEERAEIRIDGQASLHHLGSEVEEILHGTFLRAEQLLLGFKSLHAATEGLNERNWTTYIRSLEPRQVEGLVSLSYTRRVPRSQIEDFLQEIRRDQGPDFKIISKSDYPDLMVVVHQHVYQGKPLRIGRDRSDSPELQRQGEFTRRTGRVAVTRPLESIDEKDQPRLLMILPIYQGNIPLSTDEERKDAHVAWVASGLYLQDLFKNLNPSIGVQVQVDISDETNPEQRVVLFHKSPPERISGDVISYAFPFSFGNSLWQVRLLANPRLLSRERAALADQLLAGGLAATALLGLLIWSTARTETRALSLARKITHDLQEREWTLREAQRIANVGICICDLTTKTVTLSEEYKRLLDVSAPPEESSPHVLLAAVHADDRPRIAELTDRFIRGVTSPPTTFRVLTRARGERILFLEHGILEREETRPLRVMSILHDITDRIAADRALAESHAQLEQLMKVMPGAVFQLQRFDDGRLSIPFISEGASTLFGLQAASLVANGQQLLALMDPAQAQQFDESLNESGRSLEPWHHEAPFHLPFGGQRWARYSAIPERRHNELNTIWRGVVIDITSAKEAEQTLRENEQRLRFTQFAVDHVGDAVAFVSPEGSRIYVNDETCRLTGYSRTELLENKIWTTFTSFTLEAYCQLWGLIKRQGSHTFEAKLRTKEGNNIPVEVSASFIEFGQREIIFAIARDISARKAADQALRASEERLRLTQFALDHAQDIVSIIDADGNRLYVNETFCHYTGQTREELFSTKLWESIPSLNEQRYRALWEDIKRCGTLTFEIDMLTKVGEKKPVEVNASHLNFGGREAVCTISRDLSARQAADLEKKRMEQQLRETQKLESLGVLAGGIAHDFNNLLTGILGNANLARDRLPDLSELHEPLSQIERASTRAAELCQQMLAYAGKGRFVVEPVSLTELVEETAKLIDLSIGRRATLDLRLDANIPLVLADATQMRQIVMNLVINAAESIPHSQGRIVVATGCMHVDRTFLAGARVAGLGEGDGVFLEVTDNGAGMDRATLDRVFDPFFTTKFTGRGLGLAAVLGIVRAHEGALHVQSEVNRGTTFRLVLSPYLRELPRPPKKTAHPTPTRRNEGRILVVDDEESVRSVTKQALERTGFIVETAEDGEAALIKLQENPGRFSVILLDYTMPRLDGAQTLREIRRLHAGAQVILMSGFSEQETRDRIGDEPLAGFVQKPFDLSVLRAQVERAASNVPAERGKT